MIQKLSLFCFMAILLSVIYLNEGCNVLKPAPTPTAIPTATLTPIPTAAPLSFQDYYNKALSLSKQKKYDEALTFFNKALEIEPKNKTVKKSKLEILKLLNKIKKIELYIDKGNELYERKQFNDSIAYYNKAIELDPQNKDAWLYKGYSYECLEKYKIAIDCYNKVLKLDPGNPDAIECSVEAKNALSNPSPLPKESIREEADAITQIDSSSDDNWKDYGIEVCMYNPYSDSRIGKFHLKNPTNNGAAYWYNDIIAWLGRPSSTYSEIFSEAYIKPSRFGKNIKGIGEIVYLQYGVGYIFRKDYNSNGMIVGIHVGEKLKSTSCYYVVFSDKVIRIGSNFSDLCSDSNKDVYVKKNKSTYEIVSPNLGILFITSGKTIEESKVTDIIISYSALDRLPVGINIE